VSGFRDEGALEVRADRLRVEQEELRSEVDALAEQVERARERSGGAENHNAFLRRLREDFEELRHAVDELSEMLAECEGDFGRLEDRREAFVLRNHQVAREMRRKRLGR
jgi:uncharacterized coiled-coil DUF342 family protein